MGLRFRVKGADFSGLGLGNVYTEADRFIIAAGITNTIEKGALVDLYNSLLASGIFAKAYGVYPFIGIGADTRKWNLKNPIDSDAAGRLTFIAGGAHSVAGFTGGANSHIVPVSNADICLSVFNSVGAPAGGSNTYIGVNNHLGTSLFVARQNDLKLTGGNAGSSSSAKVEAAASLDNTKTGLLTVTRGANSLQSLYDGATLVGTDSTVRAITNPTGAAEVYVAGLNNGGSLAATPKLTVNFAYIGRHLTAEQVAALNSAVIAFNTALGR